MENQKIQLFVLTVLAGGFLNAEEVPTCHRCQIIREENAKKGPPEFEYYDDYLKAQDSRKPQDKAKPTEDEEAKDLDRS
jgi:hypothetical protein